VLYQNVCSVLDHRSPRDSTGILPLRIHWWQRIAGLESKRLPQTVKFGTAESNVTSEIVDGRMTPQRAFKIGFHLMAELVELSPIQMTQRFRDAVVKQSAVLKVAAFDPFPDELPHGGLLVFVRFQALDRVDDNVRNKVDFANT
jgi:hypothetical protein